MPTARRQPSEQRVRFRRRIVEMKGLGIVGARKGEHLVARHRVLAIAIDATGREILEPEHQTLKRNSITSPSCTR